MPEDELLDNACANKRGRTQEGFLTKLFKMFDLSGYSSIILWLPYGRAFKICNKKLFERDIMKSTSSKQL